MAKTVLVSNRLAVSTSLDGGEFHFKPSVGGLATGISSLYADAEKVWVGWSGLPSDDLNAEQRGTLESRLQNEHDSLPVFLSNNDLEQFYYGFCNNIIWPLFHYFPTYVEYDQRLWEAYERVNRIYFDRVMEVAEEDDFIWVHDYQLMLLPAMLKEALPGSRIGFFLHIPFPSFEIFRLLPWRLSILNGLLGADLVGFHTYDYARHFLSSIRRLMGLENDLGVIRNKKKLTKVDVFPMGIDYRRYADSSEDPKVKPELEKIRSEIKDQKLVLSVDRLDYSKGIPQRLRAFHRFLQNYPDYEGKITMIMIVSPSRTKVPHYQELKRELDELVSIINGTHGRLDWIPIRYFFRTFPFHELTAMYNLADVLLVTPLRDGMNLIAKEYVASRKDGRASVVLSETAGSARELAEALIVNPSDIERIAERIREAIELPETERIDRTRRIQARLERYDVHYWAKDFVEKIDHLLETQQRYYVRKLGAKDERAIVESYRGAEKRLILLDFDGTLVEQTAPPERVELDTDILESLRRLSSDERNRVVVLSRRTKEGLAEHVGEIPVVLAAEHGIWMRRPGEDWTTIENFGTDWKDNIRPILELYVDRTAGSFLEEKDYSIAWHFERSEPELAANRLSELKDALLSFTENHNISLFGGNKVLEVKHSSVNKGTATAFWLEQDSYDFIFAAGDDWTDEDMFSVLPEKAYSVKVGIDISSAQYFLESHKGVRALIGRFVD